MILGRLARKWQIVFACFVLGWGMAAFGLTSRPIHLVELAVFTGVWTYLFTLYPETVRQDAALHLVGVGFVAAGVIPYAAVTLLFGLPLEREFLLLKTNHGLYANLSLMWVTFGYALLFVAVVRLVRGAFKKGYFRWSSEFRQETPIKDPSHELHIARRDR